MSHVLSRTTQWQISSTPSPGIHSHCSLVTTRRAHVKLHTQPHHVDSASRPFTCGIFGGGSLPRNAATHSRHVEDSTRPVMGHPLIDNPRIIVTSSWVTIISPYGRWKELVFGLHLSTIVMMAVALNTGMPRSMMLVIASRLTCRRRGR
jgi:hypothetical protein